MVRPLAALLGLWALWIVSWLVAALWTDRTERRPRLRVELGYRVIQILAAVLLALPRRHAGVAPLWRVNRAGAWLCVALVALGMAFAWWARIHLGRLWSGHITRKVNHKVVDTGPYALVRHPIYTGLLLALAATAAVKGTVAGLSGAVLFGLGFYLKARIEEGWLTQQLGADAYASYRQRVPMLLPLPRRSKR